MPNGQTRKLVSAKRFFFRGVTKGRCFICRRGHWNPNFCDNWVMSLHTATMCFWGLGFLFVMADHSQHFHWVNSLHSLFSRLSWLLTKGNSKLSEIHFPAAGKGWALSLALLGCCGTCRTTWRVVLWCFILLDYCMTGEFIYRFIAVLLLGL